ncbi:type I toxin-antitoxin system Ibs family toxin [Escherichia coli]|nr:type I toxin-antitoxin system Ibs family toxin [Escherichia coli]MDX5545341.1 type I toxin-antitoxin system Ibs family toxin [Escherichia coli]
MMKHVIILVILLVISFHMFLPVFRRIE